MARRRYVSTNISLDKVVNQLAVRHGDFAVLLYTWMIPHAADDCSIIGDPEELLMLVMPGRRDKEVEDIVAAINGMLELGLVFRDGGNLIFPPETFYRYQSYIKEENRRKSAENTEEQRKAPENAVSPSLTPSVSVSPPPSPPGRETAAADAAPPSPPVPLRPVSNLARETAEVLVSAHWVGDEVADVARAVERSFALVPEFNSRDGPLLAEQYVRWKGYRKKPPEDWYRAWLNWVKKERNGDVSGSQATGTPGGAAAAGAGTRRTQPRAAPAYDYDGFLGLKPSGTS